MSFQSKQLLLVEDQPLIALNHIKALEKRGYIVTHVLSGKEAITFALNPYSRLDLILMDIDLGEGIDGTEAARLILRGKDIPILFLSSHTENEIVEKTEGISSYGYVVKNTGIVILDASIKMAFKLFDAKMKEHNKDSELRRSEVKFRMLFEQMQFPVFFHKLDGTIVDVNPAACTHSAYSKDELLGMSIFDLHPDRQISGSSVAAIREKWVSWESGQRVVVKTIHRRKDGSLSQIELSTGRIDFEDDHIMCAIVKEENISSACAECDEYQRKMLEQDVS